MIVRASSNMPFSLNSVTDVGVIAYLGVNRWFADQAQQDASTPLGQLTAVAGLAVTILAGVWVASRMWEQFRSRGESNKRKLDVDDGRIRDLEKAESAAKLELIERRAKVDRDLLKLEIRADNFKERIAMLESRHNRLRDAFNRLAGSLAPILKDMDVDLSRLDVVGKLIASADEDTTDNGSNGSH